METKPAIDYSFHELAGILDRGFEGYVVRIAFAAPLVHAMVRTESVDLSVSPVAIVDGVPVGIALIGRRGRESRLAAMAVSRGFRGQGIGRALVEQVVSEARLRGDRDMELECIQSNEAAVKLYDSMGFERVRELIGFIRDPGPLECSDDVEEIELREVALALAERGPVDLPWQVAWPSLAASSTPSLGFRLGDAVAAITSPEQPAIAVRALVAARSRCGSGSGLMRALISRWPEKIWRVAPMWPSEIAPGFWEGVGFRRDALSQYQMRKSF